MTGEDDKSNKSNKMETRRAGKKVVKSPVKNSSTQRKVKLIMSIALVMST